MTTQFNPFERKVKLIISEIDGVLTSGSYAEDELGNTLYKVFNQKDFSAINELKKYYKIVFLSDDNKINYNMCQRKNLPFYWGKGGGGKYALLPDILRRYSSIPDETIYIGSKLSDKKCLQMIPYSMCPDDAGLYLRSLVWAPLVSVGGAGVFVELLDLLQVNIQQIENNL